MSPPRTGRRARWGLLVTLAVATVVVSTPLPAEARAPDPWTPPVGGRVLRGFQEPLAQFAPGHRGVDFAAAPGIPVRAANDGVVTFAGSVAGTLHVVVAHDGAVRTSYSFLARVDVRTGQSVRRAQVVGAAGGTGDGHGPGVVHFGVRVGERYVDPMLLFGPPDLTKLVRLIPSESGPGHPLPERDGLLNGFEVHDGCGGGVPLVGDAISAACDVAVTGARAVKAAWDKAGEYLDAALRALKAAGRVGQQMARRLGRSLHALLGRLQDVSAEVADRLRATRLGRVLDAAVTAGRYLVESFVQECSEHAPPADGTGGSGNVLLAVGGIDSHRDQDDARSFDLPAGRLGYAPGERYWFSYRESSGTYSARDTYQDLRESARLLARQLRQAQRDHPGRAFDLIGHSQGGVVIDVFLVEFYEGHENEYPPIENVVTFASPHEGTPLATTAQDLRASAFGSVFLGVLGALDESPGLPGPQANAASIQQLGERSDVIREIQQAGVPESVHYTSIAGADDPVVPADHADLPGAQTLRLHVGSALESHSGILGDPRALMAARAALEHRPLPCTGYREKLESAIGPVLVTTIETIAGPGP